MRTLIFTLLLIAVGLTAFSFPYDRDIEEASEKFAYVERHFEDGTTVRLTVAQAVELGLDPEIMNICQGQCEPASMPDCPKGKCAKCIFVWWGAGGYCDWMCVDEGTNQ